MDENNPNFDYKGSILENGKCDFSSVSSDSSQISETENEIDKIEGYEYVKMDLL